MTYSSPSALVLSLSLLLLSACATDEAQTGKKASTLDSTPAVPVKTPKQSTVVPAAASAPQTYDTVETCLSRIPANSTAGTRMLAEQSCRRESSTGSLAGADARTRSRVASGSVEDSVEACLSRIPQDSSAGQRMMAEASCKRDQANQR
jgi:hypothetical protein